MSALESLRWRRTDAMSDRARLGAGSAVAAGGYAWWATGLRPFSVPLTAAVLGGAVVAVAVGAMLAPTRVPRPGRPGRLDVWAALGAALALWELAAFLHHPRAEHPTLSSLTNTLFESHVARAFGLLLWLRAGTRLARR